MPRIKYSVTPAVVGIAALVAIAAMLTLTGAASATPPTTALTTAMSLSSPSALSTQIYYSTDGSYMVSTVALDTKATTATMGTDGYLCGNVLYRATQRWYDFWGIVLWTYRSTFGVHVCNNHVQYLTALYDEAMDSTLGWQWCGNIVRSWTNLSYEARSYTKGCFDVLDKILDVRYPWAKMTIGGNGGLWSRTTGVG